MLNRRFFQKTIQKQYEQHLRFENQKFEYTANITIVGALKQEVVNKFIPQANCEASEFSFSHIVTSAGSIDLDLKNTVKIDYQKEVKGFFKKTSRENKAIESYFTPIITSVSSDTQLSVESLISTPNIKILVLGCANNDEYKKLHADYQNNFSSYNIIIQTPRANKSSSYTTGCQFYTYLDDSRNNDDCIRFINEKILEISAKGLDELRRNYTENHKNTFKEAKEEEALNEVRAEANNHFSAAKCGYF